MRQKNFFIFVTIKKDLNNTQIKKILKKIKIHIILKLKNIETSKNFKLELIAFKKINFILYTFLNLEFIFKCSFIHNFSKFFSFFKL